MSKVEKIHYNKKYNSWSINDPFLLKAKKEDEIVLRELLLYTQLPNSSRILELGCGVGYKSQIMYELGYKVKAVDLSETAIMKAKEWWDRSIDFSCHDFLVNSEVDEQFDIIYASSFSPLKHEFKKQEFPVLSKIFELIRPGGVFIFEWGRNSKFEEKYNEWGYITKKDVKRVLSRFGKIVAIFANHRQLAPILNGYYLSKIVTEMILLESHFHNQGHRLYVIVSKS